MPEPIEELYVVIGSDISKLLKETKEGVDRVEKELKQFGDTAEKETKKASKGLGALKNAWKALSAVIAAAGVAAIVGFFAKIGGAAIKASSEFEVFTVQFETLLGSASAAKKRLEELTKFGIETPFELNEIVEASRILEVFGGEILATGDNLRMIGDIAAGVKRPFEDVATWVGRMYDAMQSGRPFGEASARLQEMGALSGKARAELEKMQKEGASGAEMWTRFNELVGAKFAGNMDRLAGTLAGITSNLIDFKDNLLRIGGAGLFDEVKDEAQELLDILSEEEFRAAVEALAESMGNAAAAIADIVTSPALEALDSIEPEKLNQLAAALDAAAAALSEFTDSEVTADINGLIDAITVLADTFTSVTNTANNLKTSLAPVSAGIEEIKNVAFGVVFPVTKLVKAFEDLNDLSKQITGKEIVDFSRDVAESTQTAKQKSDEFMKSYKEGLQSLYEHQKGATNANDDLNESLEETATVSDAATKAVDSYGSELLDLQESINQESIELEEGHTQALTEIQDEYTDSLAEAEEKRTKAMADAEADRSQAIVDANKNRTDAIADLEKDLTKQRKDIIESTRKDLAKLEQETDRTLKEEQDSFNKDELRDTEDHLDSLRQLRQKYLEDIDGAVKNRDARALVDARKRYNEEKNQQENAFETNQSRAREDQDERLRQIREEESRRAEEIMTAQSEELQRLSEHEAEKRLEIEQSYQEQLQAADAAYQEAATKAEEQYQEQAAKAQERRDESITKEQENYEKEKEQLDQQIAERLEQIAKGLADQDEITDEEAKAILETFAKYFGADGEIDKLMDDFANRRRAKLEIQVSYQTSQTDVNFNPGGGSGPGYNPYSTNNVPSFAGGGSMFANRPTLVQFGEVPEIATFTPLSKMRNGGNEPQRVEVDLKMSGSAPPGIRSGDRDQIAGVLLTALMDAGLDRASGGRGQ